MKPIKVAHLHIARDFAINLFTRLRTDGEKSGQEFLEDFLEPACLANDKVVINLDGIDNYSTSWMDEAFSGFSRKYGVEIACKKIRFTATEKPWRLAKAESFIQVAGGHAI